MTNYTTEQIKAIEEALDGSDADHDDCSYEWSDSIIKKGDQQFAPLGSIAYELIERSIEDRDSAADYVPVIIDCKALIRFLDKGAEGPPKVLHLFRMTRYYGHFVEDPKWRSIFLQTGWVYPRDLNVMNEEIIKYITEEADRGETPLTRPPPGWE